MSTTDTQRFQSGGTLREGSLYVKRRADDELPAALALGEFCHVLAPRQMGKSSLRARTESVLRAAGLVCGCVDLTAIGTMGITTDQFYFGLVDELSRALKLPDPLEFWMRNERRSPVHRWSRYLRDEVLTRISAPVVVFFDEIDSVRSLASMADDFFASLRAVYNARAEDAACGRLTFCFLGVAAPMDLTRDTSKTPFNVGRGIRLEDFTRAEADVFAQGLLDATPDLELLLDVVYEWTEGHPYMMQRICEVLAERGVPADLPIRVHVAALVGELFLRRGRVEDLNLAAVERVFARDRGGARTRAMLELYLRLLDDEHVPAMSDDPTQTALRLTGLAAERDDGAAIWVRVRNQIYESVFDQRWVHERMARDR